MVAAIELEGVAKRFSRGEHEIDDAVPVIQGLDLVVEDGEFLCLLGPTGCGKSTVLNMIAGFEPANAGQIRVFGSAVTGPSADRGVVFQSEIALFSWLTVEENAAFGLKMRGLPVARIREVVDQNLELVGLAPHRHKFPRELSGGMKQRVQIARALANDPRILLMDEPFGALDAQTRRRMQGELAQIWMQARKTVLFITHDINEAIWLGDRVAVMSHGPGAHVIASRTIDLPRPREAMTAEFSELYNELNGWLHPAGEGSLDAA